MAPRSFRIGLSDIRGEIAGIRDLTKDANAEIFAANWGMKRAVEQALLIVAEAAKHIPDNLKASRPEVPWKNIHVSATCCAMNIVGSMQPSCGRS